MKIEINTDKLTFKEKLVAKNLAPIVYKVLYCTYEYFCEHNNIPFVENNYELYCQYILDLLGGAYNG